MDKRAVVEFLITRIQRWHQVGVSASEGTSGQSQIMQRDLNKAIEAWMRDNDRQQIKQVVATLYAFGNLTETEHQQIMKAIDGD